MYFLNVFVYLFFSLDGKEEKATPPLTETCDSH